MKNKLKYIISILMLCMLITIIYFVKTDKIVSFDNFIYNLFTSNITNTKTMLFKTITHLASFPVIVILCILSLILIKDKKIGTLICINSINSEIINKILKMIFIRPRPDVIKLIRQGGYSFPSGHAMASMSLYGFIIYLIYKSNLSNGLKKTLIIIITSIILLIGISRIYLGVHYASDIIAGYLFSIIYMFIFTNVIKYIETKL